jgi:hypothetical protein
VRRDSPTTNHAAITVRKPTANLLTAHRAALLERRERLPSLEDRLLGATHAGVQRDCDLLVRKAAQLAKHERAALSLRKTADVRHQGRPPGPLRDALLGGGRGFQSIPVRTLAIAPPVAQNRDGLVVGDAE